ncbi:uncharacterized protein LOC121372431 [Gigantopelta aegis]|uniref:uncharacterized protein LOC121372431 n=1 Tax=Gigantopelta aegis TaxID=1735272 RepID=UPI001B888617|nr:uncharacterized protein LOC121372431 [Gigantopelta aegis]
MAKGDHDSHDKKSPDNSNVERKSSVSQRKKTNLPVNGYCSSSESDGEGRTKKSSPVIRRKKSFFKKAKERLISTFHRDEKSDDDDIYIHGPEKDKKKKRSKHKKVAHDASRFSQGDVSGNATVHADADLKLKVNDVPDGNGASAEHEGPLRRNSAGKRFLDSVRKSFRMKKKSHVPESHSAEPVSSKSGRDYSRSSSTSNDRTSLLNLPMPKAQGLSESETSTTRHPEPARQDQSINVNPGLGRLWPATIPEHGPYDTDFKRRDDKHGPYDTDYKHSDDGKTYVKTDDGLWEQNNPQSGHQGPGGSYLPQISIETDGKDDESDGKTRKDLKGTDDENIPFDEKTESEKEDVIAKVVQKLIEIGDNIAIQSHSSDSESRNRPSTQAQAETTGASAPGDDALSSLEREILECLRVGGDRLSETMEDPTVGLIQEATQSVYDQFTQTIRQTVGDEVNWHQMALVFHASRTALNAVGVGTTKARRLKEMTIKYVTDKCASWIYEQGGWESVVSEDSDLD